MSARQACQRHCVDILPFTTCTFHVAPEAGWARLKGACSEPLRCFFHCEPLIYIAFGWVLDDEIIWLTWGRCCDFLLSHRHSLFICEHKEKDMERKVLLDNTKLNARNTQKENWIEMRDPPATWVGWLTSLLMQWDGVSILSKRKRTEKNWIISMWMKSSALGWD